MEGEIEHHKCDADIIIYFPVDSSDRRAVVALRNPHSHPMFPYTKVSLEGEKRYREAAEQAGTVGLTVLKLDKGDI